MDLLRFLYIMEKMLSANGHFVALLRVNTPDTKRADGWLITGQNGERFLVTCRELSVEESTEIALRTMTADAEADDTVEWGRPLDAAVKETT